MLSLTRGGLQACDKWLHDANDANLATNGTFLFSLFLKIKSLFNECYNHPKWPFDVLTARRRRCHVCARPEVIF